MPRVFISSTALNISLGEPVFTISPLSTTATACACSATYSGSCSTSTMVIPSSCSFCRTLYTLSFPTGSNWDVGSSKTKQEGFIVSIEAMATFCFSPPDNEKGNRSLSCMLIMARASSILFKISSRGSPRFSGPKASSSSTLMANNWDSGFWSTMPTVSASSYTW